MKLNYESIVFGNNSTSTNNRDVVVPLLKFVTNQCILVPYRPEHVPTYHDWMCDPKLLAATASEPLSLQEEYEMQQSWYHDPKKCTFIVVSRNLLYHKLMERNEQSSVLFGDNIINNNDTDEWLEQLIFHGYNHHQNNDDTNHGDEHALAQHDKEKDELVETKNDFISQSLSAMVGDVNLFLSEYEFDTTTTDDDDDNDNDRTGINMNDHDHSSSLHEKQQQQPLLLQGEIDIMIANPEVRNQGYGYEAIVLMMIYTAIHIPNIQRFFCKIHISNIASQYLFRTKLQFVQCNYTECFQEYEYEFCCRSTTNNNKKSDDDDDASTDTNAMMEMIVSKLMVVPPSSPSQTKESVSSLLLSSSFIRIVPCPLHPSSLSSSASSSTVQENQFIHIG